MMHIGLIAKITELKSSFFFRKYTPSINKHNREKICITFYVSFALWQLLRSIWVFFLIMMKIPCAALFENWWDLIYILFVFSSKHYNCCHFMIWNFNKELTFDLNRCSCTVSHCNSHVKYRTVLEIIWLFFLYYFLSPLYLLFELFFFSFLHFIREWRQGYNFLVRYCQI